MAAADKPNHGHSKARAWFCTTGLPSDILVHVGDVTFHLHKFPLMSKSKELHDLITQREISTAGGDRAVDGEEEEEIEEEVELQISLPDFPGGPEVFEAAAKFCYGVKLELTAWNAVPLRCAAQYLEMTEAVAEDNLAARADKFLRRSVFPNLRESVRALKSCEDLLPLADDLGLVQLCIDSIASAAASAAADPSSSTLFDWPVIEARSSPSALWNGIEVSRKSSGQRYSSSAGAPDSWLEDLGTVGLQIYKRVINAMKRSELSSEIIESCLIYYAKRSIPGITRSGRQKNSSAPVLSEPEQRELLETVISNLPPPSSNNKKKKKTTTPTRLLFGLLRTANILRASEEAKTALEKKIAAQMEQATLDDLLVPSYSYTVDTLYDVGCVDRILNFFLQHNLLVDQDRDRDRDRNDDRDDDDDEGRRRLMVVGKLVDGYLAEIASDANLKVEKFCELAVALPSEARLCDDGLYRAVDLYLKAHPSLGEEEREQICGVMDCGKLTPDACTHAAQNERLPLRVIVQVLFFDQLQLRQAIEDTILISHHNQQYQPESERTVDGEQQQQERVWRAAVRENQVLRLDMDSMRSRVQELERECSSMKKTLVKIDGGAAGDSGGRRRQKPSAVGRRWGCKLKTQVCDSHERTVVESRRSRNTPPQSTTSPII